MNILQKDDGHKGAFHVQQDNEMLAEMTYVWAGTGKIIIDHTFVDEKLKGQGAGKKLVAAAVDFARSKGITILPLCPFAKSVFDKEKDWNDVL
jgi:predicted GNAT family acetyltransferase